MTRRRPDGLDLVNGGSLAQPQGLHLDGKNDGDGHQEGADEGSSGALAVRMKSVHARLPRAWLLSVIAVRKVERSSVIATSSTAIGIHHQMPVVGSRLVEPASDYCGGCDWSELEHRSEDDLQLVHNMNISQPVSGDHPPQ